MGGLEILGLARGNGSAFCGAVCLWKPLCRAVTGVPAVCLRGARIPVDPKEEQPCSSADFDQSSPS